MRKCIISALACLVVPIVLSCTVKAGGAQLNEIKVEKFGYWRVVLYKNAKSGKFLCAVETEQNGGLLRVNHYTESNDTFLELSGENWDMLEGDVRFSLVFNVQQEQYKMELKGRSWGTDYTHDILDKTNFYLMLGLLMKSNTVRIINSNSTQILQFDLKGSTAAIAQFGSCMKQ
jgi:hypothetical protein